MNERKAAKKYAAAVLMFAVLAGAAAIFGTKIIARGADAAKKPAYIGAETCLTCHDGYNKAFMGTKHRMLFGDLTAKGPKNGCEACHGPAEEHLNDSGTGVNRFEKMDAGKISAVCLKCHLNGDKQNWPMTAHSADGISCINCHDVHGNNHEGAVEKEGGKANKKNKETAHLLVDEETALCTKCHQEKAAQINLPSHHPVKEGKVTCSSCHSPHNNTAAAMENAKTGCVKCHPENAGPFLNEHEPVTEACTNCHTPHGSPNSNLLVLREPALCLQCHSVAIIGPSHDLSSATFKKCTSCHESIHGSNSSQTYQTR